MSDQHMTSKILIHLNHHPGVYTSKILADAVGCSTSTASRGLQWYLSLNPSHCTQLNKTTFMVTAPEVPDEVKTQPEPPPLPTNLLTFEEILPDDEDLYPPFKCQIYDHYRSRKGERWYRAKDELGRRLIFTWIDDED